MRKNLLVFLLIIGIQVFGDGKTSAQTLEGSIAKKEIVSEPISSKDLVAKAWEASGKNDLGKVTEITAKCEQLLGEEAKKQEASLSNFPARGKEQDYQTLNDVGTCLFIRAEALMNNGKFEEAQALFQRIIVEFKWAQAWDPSRGSFWSAAEKSQASIDMLSGKVEQEEEEKSKLSNRKRTLLKLHVKGKEDIVDYEKYGQFIGVGAKDYRYQINSPQGLAAAVGEGIYPNTSDILKDPGYKEAQKAGRLEGSHWDFVYSEDLQAAFYKWALAPEPWGVKLFYLGLIFEKAKMYYEAIKAYQAIVVHFPQAVGWTYWQTPWYPAQAAIFNCLFRGFPPRRTFICCSSEAFVFPFPRSTPGLLRIASFAAPLDSSFVSKTLCSKVCVRPS